MRTKVPLCLGVALFYVLFVLYSQQLLSASSLKIHLYLPATGLLLAVLLLVPYRSWLVVVSIAYLLEQIVHFTAIHPLQWHWSQAVFSISDEIATTMAALLVRRWVGPNARWTSFRFLLRLAVTGILVGATIGATMYTLQLFRGGTDVSYFLYWRTRWLADSLGILTITPMALWTWLYYQREERFTGEFRSWECPITIAVCLTLVLALFCQPEGTPRPFLLYPPLIWLAARLGPLITSWTMTATVLTAVGYTNVGLGPFVRFGSESRSASAVQMFLLALVLSALSISCNLFDRARSVKKKEKIWEELQDTESRYEALFESAAVAIMVVGSSKVERANLAARELFGRTELELQVPLDSLSAARQSAQESLLKAWPDQIKDGTVLPWTVQNGSGEILELEVYLTILELKSGSKVQVVARDKTRQIELQAMLEAERRSLQTDVAAATAKLEGMNRELAHANNGRNRFLATINHELKTPLTAILGRCETLREGLWGELTAKQSHALQRISESGTFLGELVSDLLDISKASGDGLFTKPKLCSVRDACESSLRLVASMASHHGVEIVLKDLPSEEFSVESRICKQILVNLLTNSIKFTPPGGKVEVGASFEAGILELRVTDNGRGIPEELKDRIFQPFSRGDHSIPGFGLGLSLIDRLVRSKGGTIDFHSELQKGTTFTVRIPVEKANANANADQAPSETPLRIFVDESQSDAMTLVSRYFEERGYEVTATKTWDQIDTWLAEHRPNIAFFDCPDDHIDFVKVLETLRSKRSELKDCILVVLCECPDESVKSALFEAGVTSVLPRLTPLPDLEKNGISYLKKPKDSSV